MTDLLKQKRIVFNDIDAKENLLKHVVRKNAHLTWVMLFSENSPSSFKAVVELQGPGAKVQLIGIVLGSGDKQLSLETVQLHKAPLTTSNLLVKSILADQSKFNYDGTIRVERVAQKTDAYQRNENLILSPRAQAESHPTLEILANDVRCTHGATIGTLSKEELWYLESRGIAPGEARRLMIYGFLESALATVGDPILYKTISRRIASRL